MIVIHPGMVKTATTSLQRQVFARHPDITLLGLPAASDAAKAAIRRICYEHAGLEGAQDLEGTMATLVADPVYDLQPIGRRMRGLDLARRYYEHLFAEFTSRTKGADLIAEWVGTDSLAQEYEVTLDFDGTVEKHRVIGILLVADGKLAGERLHASEATFRRMFGPLLDELPAIDD